MKRGLLSAALALWLLSGSVSAEPITSGQGDADPTFLDEYFGEQVCIGDPNAGVDVWHDPNGGPILKLFNVPQGTGDVSICITEHWHVVGPAITDWHEELMVWGGAEAGWVRSVPNDGLYFSATITVSPGGGIYGSGDAIDIYWQPPLGDCTQVCIVKTVIVERDFFDDTQFAIFEWPTPEPATMALLGVGLAVLVLHRKR